MIKLLSVAVRFTKDLGWYNIDWIYWIAKLPKEFLIFVQEGSPSKYVNLAFNLN